MNMRDVPWARRSNKGFIVPWKRCRLSKKFGNVRTEFPEESIADKANSLILNGQRTAITGKLSDCGEFFDYTDGDMRVKACKYAETILKVNMDDVINVGPDGTGGFYCELDGLPDDPIEVKFYQITRGTDTVPLSKMELGKAFKSLVDSGVTIHTIAERLKKSDQHIRDMIKLADIAPELQQAVAQGAMSPTTAVKTARARKEAQEEVKEKLERGERVKGVDVSDGRLKMMSIEDIQGQIKKADILFSSAKSDKDRIAWQYYIRALRSVIGLDDKL